MSRSIYTRHKLTRYVRQFLSSSRHAYGIISEYDFGFADQYVFGHEFQRCLSVARKLSRPSFADCELNEIVRRCRVLRSMEYDRAISFIGAAELIVDRFIEQKGPTLVVAPRIDTYLLDVLERKLHLRGVRYLGVWRSAFQRDTFFLTNRGEIHAINEPTDDACIDLIAQVGDMQFKATSLSQTDYSTANLLLNHGRRISRDVALEAIRKCGVLKVGYRELATGFHTEDYRCPPSSWIGRFSSDEDIRSVLRSHNKKIFVALQVNPESTIDYYCSNLDLIDIDATLTACVNAFVREGFTVIIKDHPNMFGRRNFTSINALLDGEKVFLARYGLTSNEILSGCDAVFTWSGTVAVQAYFNAIPCITICSPFAVDAPGFFRANSVEKVQAAAQSIAVGNYGRKITRVAQVHLARNILRTHKQGAVFTHDRQTPDAGAFAAWLDLYEA
jgi:hypothetical protein